MKKAKKPILLIIAAFILLYIGTVIGYNIAGSETTQLKADLSKAQAAANETSKTYDALLADHNSLVEKWNQQQKDITAGKYTQTQYVQGPTKYVPSYTAPVRCSTQYYSYLNSSSTTCY